MDPSCAESEQGAPELRAGDPHGVEIRASEADATDPNAIETRRAEPTVVFTIGHSNHPIGRFGDLLVTNAVDVVADVRTYPSSRYAPQFNRPALEVALVDRGIGYVFLGCELGGRPPEPELHDTDGRVRYDRVAATDRFRSGLARLLDGATRHRIAILCAEEDPSRCHRHLLVAPALLADGVDVIHLRADGRAQTERELAEAERPATVQPPLFPGGEG